MSITELIPKLEFDSPLETALAKADAITESLAPLLAAAESIEVSDADSYAEIGRVLSVTRSIKNNEIAPVWSPFQSVVERVRDYLRQKRMQSENLCERIDALCRTKMKVYEQNEVRAAEAEEKKLNKKSDEPVTVKPNLPSVQGYRKSTIYRATVENRRAFLNAFVKARGQHAVFLSNFIVIDEQALSRYYREAKDEAQAIPGVAYCKE